MLGNEFHRVEKPMPESEDLISSNEQFEKPWNLTDGRTAEWARVVRDVGCTESLKLKGTVFFYWIAPELSEIDSKWMLSFGKNIKVPFIKDVVVA